LSQNQVSLSLQRQLLLWLLLPQLLLWLVGGTLAYRMALHTAQKSIDQSLTQSLRSLARQVKPMGSGLLIDFPRAAQDIIEQDPQDRVTYMVSAPPGHFVLGNGQLAAPARALLQQATASAATPLLYDVDFDGRPMRVALMEVDYGDSTAPQRLRVQLARSGAVQQRLARELVQDMLAPLLLLGSALGLLMFAGIRRGLMPLKRLAAQLDARNEGNVVAFSPLVLTQAPQEVQALAGAVNQLLDTVGRSIEQEKRFINDAAHQLRTPLAGLISQTELALNEARDCCSKALQERLSKVQRSALRSAHLVQQLLALARTDAPVQLQSLDLAELARAVARDWTPRAITAGVDLGYEGPDSVKVQGDELLLREALNNLLDNALRYAASAPQASVTVRISAAAETIRVEVMDNGPGVAPPDMRHLFERFWRASEQAGGCGLGLAIVDAIARRHGGNMSAFAVQPHGLCLRMTLPKR
jgi:two-component system sensor histidine kinase TctE